MLNALFSTVLRSTLLSLIAVTLVTSGCGFHLRNKTVIPGNLRAIYIDGDDLELIAEIEKDLRFSDITIADSNEGVAVLDLNNTQYERAINATSSTGQATSYKLEYDIKYQVLDSEGEILQEQRIIESRTFNFDASQILVAEREEKFLKEDMQKEIARRLLRWISKIK